MKVFAVLWLLSLEMNTVTRVQNLNKAVCISQRTNSIRKGIHPASYPPARDKYQGALRSWLSMATRLEERKFWIHTC